MVHKLGGSLQGDVGESVHSRVWFWLFLPLGSFSWLTSVYVQVVQFRAQGFDDMPMRLLVGGDCSIVEPTKYRTVKG